MALQIPEPNGDKRRAVRVPTRLYVRLVGGDSRPVLREGNVSTTGVYFESDASPGPIGSVERIEIKNAAGTIRFATSAALVRAHQVHDLWSEDRTTGVAYQFMPSDEETRDAIVSFVRQEAETMLAQEGGTLVTAGHAKAMLGGLGDATITHLGAGNIGLITAWPVEPGAQITVRINEGAAEDTLELRGQVEASHALIPGEQFRIDVTLQDDRASSRTSKSKRTKKRNMGAVIDAVVSQSSAVGEMRSNAALSGQLDRVPLAGLLSFIEYERISGIISLDKAGDRAVIYVRSGRPIDVEASWNARDAKLALGAILAWSRGDFRLAVRSQARPDVVGSTFSQLLLEHARAFDEA